MRKASGMLLAAAAFASLLFCAASSRATVEFDNGQGMDTREIVSQVKAAQRQSIVGRPILIDMQADALSSLLQKRKTVRISECVLSCRIARSQYPNCGACGMSCATIQSWCVDNGWW